MMSASVSVKTGSGFFGADFLHHTDLNQSIKHPVHSGSGYSLAQLFNLVKEFIRTGMVTHASEGFEYRLSLRSQR